MNVFYYTLLQLKIKIFLLQFIYIIPDPFRSPKILPNDYVNHQIIKRLPCRSGHLPGNLRMVCIIIPKYMQKVFFISIYAHSKGGVSVVVKRLGVYGQGERNCHPRS